MEGCVRIALAIPILVVSPIMAHAQHTGNYADVNGIRMYYEIHGNGDPLVLIHGGGSTIQTSFGKILPELAHKHQVMRSNCRRTVTHRTAMLPKASIRMRRMLWSYCDSFTSRRLISSASAMADKRQW